MAAMAWTAVLALYDKCIGLSLGTAEEVLRRPLKHVNSHFAEIKRGLYNFTPGKKFDEHADFKNVFTPSPSQHRSGYSSTRNPATR